MVALEAVVSGAMYALAALFLGSLATGGLVLPRVESPLTRALFPLARVLLLSFLIVAVFWLVVQGAKLAGGGPPSVDILTRYLLRTQSGNVWLGRELYGVFLFGLLSWLDKHGDARRAARAAFFSRCL
jgi:hypothetical protein